MSETFDNQTPQDPIGNSPRARRRRGDDGLGATANGGNAGSFSGQQRQHASSPQVQANRRRYQEAGATLTYEEDYARAFEIATRVARKYDYVDRDDIVQDALIRVFDQAQKNNYVDVSLPKQEGGRAQVITLAVQHSVARFLNGDEHHTTHSGRRELDAQRRELEGRLGRGLTTAELEELADRVRLSFPPGRRPRAGYHERVYQVELPTEAVDGAGRMQNQMPLAALDTYPSDAERAQDTTAFARQFERLHAAPEDGGIKVKDAKLQLWETFRDFDSSVPEIVELDAQARKAATQTLNQYEGGARGFAEDWLNGQNDVLAEDAFFAPFGGVFTLTTEEQVAVAERVANDEVRGNLIWAAAVEAAALVR